jgi:hypothetical protein
MDIAHIPIKPAPSRTRLARRRLPEAEECMNDHLFETITRRAALLPLGAVGLALPGIGGAKRRKRKTRKVKRNSFGCVNVGSICKNDKQCCSGICRGKQGKRKCKAHDTWGCSAGLDACVGPYQECLIAGSEDGICYTTTGNAGYCANWALCVPCTQDADCRKYCGPAAACVHCAGCPASDGMACAGTGACAFPP